MLFQALAPSSARIVSHTCQTRSWPRAAAWSTERASRAPVGAGRVGRSRRPSFPHIPRARVRETGAPLHSASPTPRLSRQRACGSPAGPTRRRARPPPSDYPRRPRPTLGFAGWFTPHGPQRRRKRRSGRRRAASGCVGTMHHPGDGAFASGAPSIPRLYARGRHRYATP
jgi:hypothetical protein